MPLICSYLFIFRLFHFVEIIVRWFGRYLRKKILTGCPRAKIVFSLMPDRILVCTHFKYTVSYFHIFFEVQFFLLVNHKIYDLVSLDRITYTNILYIHSDFRHKHTPNCTWPEILNVAYSIFKSPSNEGAVYECLRMQIYMLFAVMHFSQNAAYFILFYFFSSLFYLLFISCRVAVDAIFFVSFLLVKQRAKNNRSKTYIHYS